MASTKVHYEVRERSSKGRLRSVHRACQGHHSHYDTDDQSSDPRDVTCPGCLVWLELVVKDRKKKIGAKR